MQDRCLHTVIQERWLHTVCNARQNTWPNPCMWHMRKPSSVPTPPWMESQHRLVLGCRTCSHIRHKCGETLTSSMLRLYHYVWSQAQSVWEIEGMTWPGAAEWREEKPCCQRDEEEARTCKNLLYCQRCWTCSQGCAWRRRVVQSKRTRPPGETPIFMVKTKLTRDHYSN